MTKSNYLEKLLNGAKVEWKKLGEVADLKRGRVISKRYLEDNVGEYPVYSSQTVNNGEIGKINTFDFNGEFITWTTDGANAGTVFYRKGKFSITNVSGLIKIINTQKLNYKYLFYWLSIESKKHVYSGMGNPKLMSNQVAKIPIPIPPLPVQQEIVRNLDTFTELTTELTAELTARKKQYEYYRDKLLTPIEDNGKWFLNGKEVEWKTLGEVAEFYGGLSGKKKEDFGTGNALYITYKNIFDNIEINFDKLETVKVSDSENQHEVKYGDILFTGSSETAEEAGMSSAVTTKFANKVYLNSFSFGVRFNEDINIIPQFSKYLFRSYFMRTEIAKTASGVTRFNISKSRFKKIIIPILPLEEQERIVSILDKFDALTNSITEGLPREIELRQKQYEYYRDLLLSFPKEEA
jgi:type I restriction enzyme S subunit